MAFTKVTDPVDNISNLANQPVQPPATLKALFDEIGKDLKTYLNDVLTEELESTTNGDSGADNIGATALSGGVATTVQGVVEELDTKIGSGVSALNTHKTSADHDGRYYTESEIDAFTVKLTGDQSIDDIKEFTSSPIVPTATLSTQAVNKSQLDSVVLGQIPNDSLTNDKQSTDTKIGSLATLNALLVGFTSSITVAINKIVSWIGDLSTLTTTVKTSLVGSINELDADVALKANKSQEAWITPTLLNSWVNFSVPYEPASYYKDEFGIVHVRGFIKSGTVTSGTDIFILPEGYRPEYIVTVATGSVVTTTMIPSNVLVKPNGEFECGQNIGNVWLIINASFRAV